MDRSRCDLSLNNFCYIFSDTSLNWQAAEDSCVDWGGHLASIHSELENFAINSIRDESDFTWIGLSDTVRDGDYVWTDGTIFDFNNFAVGQPDSLRGESCFHLFNRARGHLTWNDFPCELDMFGRVMTSYVCKKGKII